jgi:hypothetical protein
MDLRSVPTIHRLSNVKLQMFAGDHNPPHFRLIGPATRCNVDLRTSRILAGHARRADLEEALEWAAGNRDLLWDVWRRLNEQ